MATLSTHWPPVVLEPRRATRTRLYSRVKRFLDVLLAALALVVALPLMGVLALWVRLDSPGPVFYSQRRVGIDRRRRGPSQNGKERRTRPGYGRVFRIYKFRSMVADAESKTGPVWCENGDPRVTRVGSLLRRTHLDELPQFVNVLRGEMSIVGPRPERPEIVERLAARIPNYAERCSTVPGITGLAQVKYTYDRSLQTAARKLEYDLYYVRYAGLLLDLKIMAATVAVMARPADDDSG